MAFDSLGRSSHVVGSGPKLNGLSGRFTTSGTGRFHPNSELLLTMPRRAIPRGRSPEQSLPCFGNSESEVRRKKNRPFCSATSNSESLPSCRRFGINFSPERKLSFLCCELNHSTQERARGSPLSNSPSPILPTA